jgi:nudix-type nucleoside diphosphatase (YffH/AdpP family)
MKPEILESKIVYDGWAKYLLAKVRLEDGHVADREIVKRGACVGVLPYDPERKVAMLVRQFRAPVLMQTGERELLEAIAGMCDGGGAEEAARREAREETGLELRDLTSIGAMWTSPGGSTERMTLYLAPYRAADRDGEGGGAADEHENITVVEMPLSELARMADAGEISDMKTFALLQTLRLKRPDLFAA